VLWKELASRGGFGDVLVEHFAHLRRRTLRNERDKVIIKIGSGGLIQTKNE
jgi:hypothetical protein